MDLVAVVPDALFLRIFIVDSGCGPAFAAGRRAGCLAVLSAAFTTFATRTSAFALVLALASGFAEGFDDLVDLAPRLAATGAFFAGGLVADFTDGFAEERFGAADAFALAGVPARRPELGGEPFMTRLSLTVGPTGSCTQTIRRSDSTIVYGRIFLFTRSRQSRAGTRRGNRLDRLSTPSAALSSRISTYG